MRILYAGDSPVGGPANYLLAILRSLRAQVVHLPPSKGLRPGLLKKKYDLIILSDFPRSHTPAPCQKAIARQVEGGAGLLMVGGWGSFSGPYGRWRGSLIEKILPVSCLNRDDRLNLPGGAWMVEKKKHSMFRDISFKNPPVICGLNRIRPKKGSLVLLSARKIRTFSIRRSPGLNLGYGENVEYPLLVIDRDPQKRVAALATDLAPHWSGGLVDWGIRRRKLPVKGAIRIEIGDQYLRFVSSLLKWLSGIPSAR